jgi:hypothetical protein
MRKRKLRLNRETLVHLDLNLVHGGTDTNYCPDTLQTCHRCPTGPQPVPSVDGCSAFGCVSDNGQCISGAGGYSNCYC